jgi:hypothetical protein
LAFFLVDLPFDSDFEDESLAEDDDDDSDDEPPPDPDLLDE